MLQISRFPTSYNTINRTFHKSIWLKNTVWERERQREGEGEKNMKDPNSLKLHNSEMSTYKCVKSISLHLV